MNAIAWRGAALMVAIAAGQVSAQCLQPVWSREFATTAQGVSDLAVALQVFDPDGVGPAAPALYVGGYFPSAGGQSISRLAKRLNGQWSSVGSFNGSMVTGLGVHDFDGPGPGLPELVAVGDFTTIDGVPIQGVARWNGSQWSPIGEGLNLVGGRTSSVVSWDHDGLESTPRRLVVSGQVILNPNEPWNSASVMMWDGSQWTAIPASALALVVFDEDGPGPQPERLFQALDWDPGLERWNGSSWEAVGGGLRSALHTCVALRVIDEDGPGPGRPALFAGGYFTIAGQVSTSGVAKWDGQTWTAVGGGINAQVEDIVAVDYTNGLGAPTIYATGWYINGHVWKYGSGSANWAEVGTTNGQMGVTFFYRLAGFDENGSGRPSLYHVASGLGSVNAQPSKNIARLVCTCRANCDGSNVSPYLSANDFQCFMNKFAAGDAYANCDGSTAFPVLTANDFQCFMNSYANGCQ